MKRSTAAICQAMLDIASVDDTVLYATPAATAALKAGKLDNARRILLERIDGFRSLEQVLAMSGDLTSVHRLLGDLMQTGLVKTAGAEEEDDWEETPPPTPAPAPVPPPKPAAKPAPAEAKKAAPAEPKKAAAPDKKKAAPPTAAPVVPAPPAPAATLAPEAEESEEEEPSELDNAKRLLLQECRHFLGPAAEKLRTRIEDSQSIEEIFDLIVKIREHVAKKFSEADSDEFLEQLIKGLSAARKKKNKK